MIDAWMWARPEKGVPAPLESARWTEGYERIAEQAGHLPQTRLVYVADREGDLLGLMQRNYGDIAPGEAWRRGKRME